MEAVKDFIFLGFKITADGDCSHEIRRGLLLGGKAMTNLDSILKGRDITLLTKAHLVKAVVFPVVMYGYESWSIKKAECRRIDAFELWCWRRLLLSGGCGLWGSYPLSPMVSLPCGVGCGQKGPDWGRNSLLPRMGLLLPRFKAVLGGCGVSLGDGARMRVPQILKSWMAFPQKTMATKVHGD